LDTNDSKYWIICIVYLAILALAYPFFYQYSTHIGIFIYFQLYIFPVYLATAMKNKWGGYIAGVISLVLMMSILEGVIPRMSYSSLKGKEEIQVIIPVVLQVLMVGWVIYRKNKSFSKIQSRLSEVINENTLMEQQHFSSQNLVQDLRKENLHYLSHLINLTEYLRQLNQDVTFNGVVKNAGKIINEQVTPFYQAIFKVTHYESVLKLAWEEGQSRYSTVEDSVLWGEGLIGKAAEQRQMMVHSTEANRKEIIHEEKDDICVAYPLLFQKKIMGILYLELENTRFEHNKVMLDTFATFIGMALHSSELMEMKQQEAITDGLTQLLNHANYEQRLKEIFASAKRYQRPLSLLLMDIDHFKHYNDTNGHQQGDVVLMDVSRLLKSNTRASDIVARYGGEEFVAIFPETGLQGAEVAAEKIRKSIESHSFPNGNKQPLGTVSISCGVSTLTDEITAPEQLVELADKALYRAKEKGRNRVEIAY